MSTSSLSEQEKMSSKLSSEDAMLEKSLPSVVTAAPLVPVISSTSEKSARHEEHDVERTSSTVSTDAAGNTYHEGGRTAYLCVFGSFCGCLMSLGFMNTLSTYQAYLITHQLSAYSSDSIGWIFGLYAFLSFFLGIQSGPLFDAYGPRLLILVGTLLIILTYICLSFLGSQYWTYILVFSVMGGTGTSLVFTPCIAAVGHHFYAKRATFTGIACAGGSMGGIIFPLALQALFAKHTLGWSWSQRILALVNIPLALAANLLVTSRLPPKRPIVKQDVLPDFGIFRDPVFGLVTVAVFFVEWGLFIPVGYLTSFALEIGIDSTLSYQMIAIFNAGSSLGRWLPGIMADKIGRFNAMVLTTTICFLSSLTFWLSSDVVTRHSYDIRLALLVLFAVIFGFGSGSGISLIPVCIGQLCKTENYGRYYATCYTIVSFATLTGIPIAGTLITAASGQYWGLIVWTAVCYVIGTVVFMLAKIRRVGFGWHTLYGKF